jgi:hypothetical protein
MNFCKMVLLAAGLGAGLSLANFTVAYGQGQPSTSARFILDMVHDNPGEPPQATAFRDPRRLREWGYSGQVIEEGAESCQTFGVLAPDVFAGDNDARKWIDAHAENLAEKARLAHVAGVKAYAWFQLLVLPRAVVSRYREDICDSEGQFDLGRPMTRSLIRAQVNEVFERCPELDGLVVRTGEIYLHDSPYHAASGRNSESKTQGATVIRHGPRSHIELLNLLREEVCAKRGKMLFYRTWDFGDNFHVNPDYYLKVTEAVEPHTNLVFSIKHQAGDFLRMTPFNPTLGIGRHPQIVEVQCQREAYGKGAHPYYVGDGVINGWEEYDILMKPGQPRGLRDFVRDPHFAGVWTWSRGGGWAGPYITNELWCALNAYVIAKYAQDLRRTEGEVFDEFARQQLGLRGRDSADFRELCLGSAAAVLRGQCSLKGPVDLWWARDDYIAAPNLSYFVMNRLARDVLAEKAKSVAQWRRIEFLAHQIHFPDSSTQEFVETSCAYGRIKYALFEQLWTILLLGEQGEMANDYDRPGLIQAMAEYDRLWQEWAQLKRTHLSCSTLYKEVAFGNQPGAGAAVARYRKLALESN